jgi:hypothetical protein
MSTEAHLSGCAYVCVFFLLAVPESWSFLTHQGGFQNGRETTSPTTKGTSCRKISDEMDIDLMQMLPPCGK